MMVCSMNVLSRGLSRILRMDFTNVVRIASLSENLQIKQNS